MHKTFMSFGYRTDHSFIGFEINIEDSNRGKGFWIFNTLLKDKTYVDMVKPEIKKTVSQYSTANNKMAIPKRPNFFKWQVTLLTNVYP